MDGRAVSLSSGVASRVGGPLVETMFRSYARDVHAYLARRVGADSALDLTSETFRVAVERIASFDPELGHERAWLFGIATNLLRNHRRAEQRRLRALAREASSLQGDRADPTIRLDDRVDAADTLVAVMERVATLDDADRDLLTLLAWENCSYAEIATALGLPIGTVRSRLHRIRRIVESSKGAPR